VGGGKRAGKHMLVRGEGGGEDGKVGGHAGKRMHMRQRVRWRWQW